MNKAVEGIQTRELVMGIWHSTRGDDTCHNGEAEIIEGPLAPQCL